MKMTRPQIIFNITTKGTCRCKVCGPEIMPPLQHTNQKSNVFTACVQTQIRSQQFVTILRQHDSAAADSTGVAMTS